MEEDYQRIVRRLQNYKISHPTLYSLWNNYLLIKKESFLDSIIKCNEILERFDTQPDFTQQQLFTLLILNNSYDLNRRH